MLHIFLDSTVYKSEPARISKHFAQLAQLAENDFLQIHISEINLGEILSEIDHEIKKQESHTLEALNKALRYRLKDASYEAGKELKVQCQSWFASALQNAKDEFNNWILQSKVVKHAINQNDTENVWKMYFLGHAPFRDIKTRDDIPDAFIWQVLLKIASQYDEFYFVSADNRLSKAVEKDLANAKTLSSISDLENYPKYIAAIAELNVKLERDKVENLSKLIGCAIKASSKQIGSDLNELIESYVWGRSIKDISTRLRGEISEIRIHETPEIEVDLVQIKPNIVAYLKFTATLDLTVDMALHRQGGWGNPFSDEYMDVDRVYYQEDFLTDTHMLGRNDNFYGVFGEAVIELPNLEINSSEDQIYEALDMSDMRITGIKFESVA
jgi:hypothetical protein